MNKLSYGLNVKSAKASTPFGVKRKANLLSAFGADDSDSEHEKASVFQRPKPKLTSLSDTKNEAKLTNKPANYTSAKSAVAQDPLDIDPSIYDYDGAWEATKVVERKRKENQEDDVAQRKPKYMGALLEAAEVRKRDQLRAKERMLQKERDNEGDEFGHKEKFVTGAYRAQQLEMQKLEEEERKREESMAKSSQGMTSFYKNILDRNERDHAEAVAASANIPAVFGGITDRPESTSAKLEASNIINKKLPGTVQVNDNGEVVDKRQLLSAGLNVAPKPKEILQRPAVDPRNSQQTNIVARGGNSQRAAQRERQTRMIAEQLEAAQKRTQEDEEKSTAELERQAKIRRTTDGDVQSARDRYLQRKREAKSKGA